MMDKETVIDTHNEVLLSLEKNEMMSFAREK
jgi:hypothetical protein